MACETSATCIDKSAFCTLCEGKANDVCACRTGCTTNDDGASCGYDTSEDTGRSGTCSAGKCQPSD